MDHLALSSHPQGEIEARVEFATGAFTAGFTADAGHRDQAADEKRFLVEELS
jgi:hypothetical protein